MIKRKDPLRGEWSSCFLVFLSLLVSCRLAQESEFPRGSEALKSEGNFSPFFSSMSQKSASPRELKRAEEKQESTLEAHEILFVPEFNLEDLLYYTFEKNAGIQAAKGMWESTLEKYPQEITLPNPRVGYRYFFSRENPRHSLMWSQEIPFPSKWWAQDKVIREEVRIARYEFEKEVRDTLVEVEKTYYEFVYLEEAIELTQQSQKVLSTLLKTAQTQYAQEKALLLEVLKGEQQIAQLSYDVVTLQEKKKIVESRLNRFLNRSFNAPLGQPQKREATVLSVSLEALQQMALQEAQELKILGHRIQKKEKEVLRAQQNYYPDLMLELAYETKGSSFPSFSRSGEMSFVGLSLELPLWYGKYQAQIRELEALKQREIALKTQQEFDIEAKVTQYYYLYQNALRLVQLYEKILLPQAQQAMEIAENLYRENGGAFMDYLETQLIWFNFQLAYQQSLKEQGLFQTDLQGIIGIRFSALTVERKGF